MEKLEYNIELAANGVIIRDNKANTTEVFQKDLEENTLQCYKKGISDTIASAIASYIFDDSNEADLLISYNIKIEIQ